MPTRALVRAPWLSLALFLGVSPAPAEKRQTLSGRWEASAMRVQWNIGEWGPACGPKPSSQGDAAGFVDIRQAGNELSMSGAGRPYSTTSCWEKQPGMSRASHTATGRSWSSVCLSAPDAARRATIKTTLTATDDVIRFDETGQFAFAVDGQNCTASSRRTRSFRLVERADAPATAPAPALKEIDEQVLAAVLPAPSRCASPGPLTKLTVTPARALLRPGQEVQFQLEGRDAKGCRVVPSHPRVILPQGVSGLEWSTPATLKLGPGAPVGELVLPIEVAGVAAEARLQVVSPERFDALMAAGYVPDDGDGPAPASAPAASIEAGVAVAEDRATMRKYWFAGVTVAMAALLGGLGFALMRAAGRHRPPGSSANPPITPRTTERTPAPSSERSGSRHSTLPSETPAPRQICPTCGSMYDMEAQFCGKDGTILVRAN